ncbi:MAG: LPS export ABC transporter periplasmic protein LptC [Desulfomonile sp.]|nr:LPS export ABC transporter periplasmic protein LptC [Desulfomonile sp.]
MDHKEIERWYRLRNLQKAAQFLIVVAVVLLFSAYLASRVSEPDHPQFQPALNVDSGMRTENFSYMSPGAHPWKLAARSASISEALDNVSLAAPQITYFGREGGEIVLSAETGRLDRTKNNFSVAGDVTIRYRDFLFKTNEIRYSQEESVAATDAPVSVEGPDLSLSGKGLRLWVKRREVSVENDVQAVLRNVNLLKRGQKLPM